MRDDDDARFEPWLDRWSLVPEGAAIITPTSRLLPVRWSGAPAMLKVTHDPEERIGAAVMAWWDGDGAARVLARDEEAVLMERAADPDALVTLSRSGDDDAACRILCDVAARLHVPRPHPPSGLTPLSRLFVDLEQAVAPGGLADSLPDADCRDLLRHGAATARRLLAAPRDIVVLHGDLHHGNVLDFGPRGILAIDPKSRIGERGFDYANIFTNPDLDYPEPPVAVVPERFRRRLAIVTAAAGLDRVRLLEWILAWTGLSAVWYLADGDPARVDLTVAALAAAELES